MRFSDLIASSIASLRQRAFRTTLTVLGVMIGTTAVIVMVSLGVGMSSQFLGDMESNPNLRTVTLYGVPQDAAQQGIPAKLTDELVTHLTMNHPEVQSVVPTYTIDIEAVVGTGTSWFQITGMPADALQDMDLQLAWGSLPTTGGGLSVVAGNQIATQFWNPMTGEPQEVDLQTDAMFVTVQMPTAEGSEGEEGGEAPKAKRFVLPVSGQIEGGASEWGPYSTVLLTDLDALVKAMQQQFPGKALPNQPTTSDGRPMRGQFVYSDIRLMTGSPEEAETLLTALRDGGYDAWAEIEWIREAQRQALMIQAVFGGIGFISLFVAAIGIANTMLMSVFERTREIGVMKVLGASLRDIRSMFIVESALIGLIGGLVGLVLSLVVSALINTVAASAFSGEMEAGSSVSVIPFWLMVGAITFATAIGTVAGLVPAQRAVRLSPLDAIRSQ